MSNLMFTGWSLATKITMWLFIVSAGAFFYLVTCINRWYRKPFIDNFTSKCVFITGTDTGFGLNLALDLDKYGVKVYAGCYTEEGAKNLQKTASNRLKTISIDIAKVESVKRAKEEIVNDLEPGQELWALVNNAGVLSMGYLFAFCSREDYKQAMDVNFYGTMNVTDAFWPLIKKSSGRIVNMISFTGRCSLGLEPYACSKHALEPYSDGLRRWMKYFGGRVAIIEPGMFTSTNMLTNAKKQDNIDYAKKNVSETVRQECGEEFIEAGQKDLLNFSANPPLSRWNHNDMVTAAMTHAMFAKNPKDRYAVGPDAKYFYRIISFLPDWIIDLLVEFHLPNISRALKKTKC